jgi:hypothetical protein
MMLDREVKSVCFNDVNFFPLIKKEIRYEFLLMVVPLIRK